MSPKTGQAAVLPTPRVRPWVDFVALTKPRVNLLVLVTTVIGFHLGNQGAADLALLINTVVGTFLVARGAAAFNQVIERDTDRDNFMGAEDAVKYGLIDRVLKQRSQT